MRLQWFQEKLRQLPVQEPPLSVLKGVSSPRAFPSHLQPLPLLRGLCLANRVDELHLRRSRSGFRYPPQQEVEHPLSSFHLRCIQIFQLLTLTQTHPTHQTMPPTVRCSLADLRKDIDVLAQSQATTSVPRSSEERRGQLSQGSGTRRRRVKLRLGAGRFQQTAGFLELLQLLDSALDDRASPQ